MNYNPFVINLLCIEQLQTGRRLSFCTMKICSLNILKNMLNLPRNHLKGLGLNVIQLKNFTVYLWMLASVRLWSFFFGRSKLVIVDLRLSSLWSCSILKSAFWISLYHRFCNLPRQIPNAHGENKLFHFGLPYFLHNSREYPKCHKTYFRILKVKWTGRSDAETLLKFLNFDPP